MDVRRMSALASIRRLIARWIGTWSWQFRDNWYRNTGTWLWGLTSLIESRPPGPRESSPIDSGEWDALLDDIFKVGSQDKVAIMTPSGKLMMRSAYEKKFGVKVSRTD